MANKFDTASVKSFLEISSTLALATVDSDGLPQVAPVFFVTDDDLNLYWLSSETSRHSVNLAAQSRVAGAVYPDVWDWQQIRGLQLEGIAQIVSEDSAREAMLTRYRAKFTLPAQFDAQIAGSTLYRLTPRWMRWLDNGLRFGYKAETTL